VLLCVELILKSQPLHAQMWVRAIANRKGFMCATLVVGRTEDKHKGYFLVKQIQGYLRAAWNLDRFTTGSIAPVIHLAAPAPARLLDHNVSQREFGDRIGRVGK
jgi:hypothetical protein